MLYGGNEDRVSLSHLTRLKQWFDRSSQAEHEEYIKADGKKRNHLGKFKIPAHMMPILDDLSFEQPMLCNEEISESIAEISGDNILVHRDTVKACQKRRKIATKTLTRYSKLLSTEKRLETLHILRAYEPRHMQNMDATSCNRWKFLRNKGRSYIGEQCLAFDWSFIETSLNSCSVMGSYTERGWSTWKISPDIIDAAFVTSFVRGELADVINEDSVLLHDGASVHTAHMTVEAIEAVFRGNSAKIASHSHDFSPVERGFANIWRFIRKNFDRTKHTTSAILQKAFMHYAVGMPGAEEAGR